MNQKVKSMDTQYFVMFDRIGLTHNPPPLLVQTDDLDDLAESIDTYARSMLMSRDVETCVEGSGKVTVFAGGGCEAERLPPVVAGCGEYRKVATLCRDEDCPTCGHPETNSIVPKDGGTAPELLAIHCRRCGGFFVEAKRRRHEVSHNVSTDYQVQFDINTTDNPGRLEPFFPEADPWATSAAVFYSVDEAREAVATLVSSTPGLHTRIITTTLETITTVVEDNLRP